MKHIVFGILLLAMSGGCSATTNAQGFSVESSKAPSVTDKSLSFTSLDGGFVISLPESVSMYQPVSVNTPAGIITGVAYVWRMAEGDFSISFLDSPESAATSQMDTALSRVREHLLSQLNPAGGKLSSESSIVIAGREGRE